MKLTSNGKEKLKRLLANEVNFDEVDTETVIENIESGVKDFTIGKYRFINESTIDEIMLDVLESEDDYILGRYSAQAIHEVTDLPLDVVEALQKHEEYEVLGSVISNDDEFLENLRDLVISWDGYGPTFSPYDGKVIEDFTDFGYYVFRV